MARFLLLATLLTLLSCGPSLDSKMEALVEGKNLWISQMDGESYSFSFRKNCYCLDDGRTVRITVRDGVTEVLSESPDESSNTDVASQFRPQIRDLFELVLELSKRELASEGKLLVEYDDRQGYPATISWDGNALHDAFVFTVENVVKE